MLTFYRPHHANKNITVTSHDGHGVSTHRQLDCLFNSPLKLTTNEHQSSTLLAFCEGGFPLTWKAYKQYQSQATRAAKTWHSASTFNEFGYLGRHPRRNTGSLPCGKRQYNNITIIAPPPYSQPINSYYMPIKPQIYFIATVQTKTRKFWTHMGCVYEAHTTQRAKTFESISIRHRCDTKVSDRCIIDID